MGVRRAAAVLALGAALGGCGNGSGADIPPAVAAAQVLPTASSTGFTEVPYDHYAEAALQTGIAPAAVVQEAGFSAGLADLCDNSPEEYSALTDRLRAEADATDDPTNSLDQSLDEVDLRVGLACRGRMADWMTARRAAQPDSAQLDSSQSEGSGDSNFPSVDPAAAGTPDAGEPTYEDYEAGYTEETGAPTASAGPSPATVSPEPAETGTSSVRLEPSGTPDSDQTSEPDSVYHETSTE